MINLVKTMIHKIKNYKKEIPLFYVKINKEMLEQGQIKDSATFTFHPAIKTLDKELRNEIYTNVKKIIDLMRNNIKVKDL